jgi:glycine/D-amino acid oxidase-like deaminating enzyme
MTRSYDIAIAGAGIFGVAAALEMRRRGYSVALIDSGPIPHPLAESTDIKCQSTGPVRSRR